MCPSSRLSSLNYRLHNSILCSKNCPSFPHTMALSYPFFPWRNHVGMWVRVGGTEPRVSRAFYLPFCLVEQASPPPARSSVDEWVSYPTIEFREGTGQVPLGPFLPRLGIYLTAGSIHSLLLKVRNFIGIVPDWGAVTCRGSLALPWPPAFSDVADLRDLFIVCALSLPSFWSLTLCNYKGIFKYKTYL